MSAGPRRARGQEPPRGELGRCDVVLCRAEGDVGAGLERDAVMVSDSEVGSARAACPAYTVCAAYAACAACAACPACAAHAACAACTARGAGAPPAPLPPPRGVGVSMLQGKRLSGY